MNRPIVLAVIALVGCRQILGIHDRDGTGGDDAPITGNHCENVADTCGPAPGESCCTAIGVPSGTFYRERDAAGSGSGTMYPATLSNYVLDKYDVTVGRFRQFIEAGYGTQMNPPANDSGAHAAIPGSGWLEIWNKSLRPSTPLAKLSFSGADCTWTDEPADHENRAMNCVSWVAAFAFCIWDGGYLPTFAEWQYAAAGGNDQRVYPWGGTTIDQTYAVYGTTAVADVGSLPKGFGRWGHADLVGNVSKLVLDVAGAFLPMPCTDCADVDDPQNQGTRKVCAGGYNGTVAQMKVVGTSGLGTGNNAGRSMWGFRCARTELPP